VSIRKTKPLLELCVKCNERSGVGCKVGDRVAHRMQLVCRAHVSPVAASRRHTRSEVPFFKKISLKKSRKLEQRKTMHAEFRGLLRSSVVRVV